MSAYREACAVPRLFDYPEKSRRTALLFKCECGARGRRRQEDRARPCTACGRSVTTWLADQDEPRMDRPGHAPPGRAPTSTYQNGEDKT